MRTAPIPAGGDFLNLFLTDNKRPQPPVKYIFPSLKTLVG